MGGSIAPIEPIDWAQANRREFNFWCDPEAVHIVLRAPWKKITVTTVDISVKTKMTKEMIAEIAKVGTPAAKYIGQWSDEEYLWDELAVAAWLDPSLITKEEQLYMDIDISHGGLWKHAGVDGGEPTGPWGATGARADGPGPGEIQQDGDRSAFTAVKIKVESLRIREFTQESAPKSAARGVPRGQIA